MNYTRGSFSLDDLNKLVKELENMPRPEYTMEMLADSYDSLSDESFIALCKTENIRFIGGLEGVRAMRKRMKQLGIK